ncbi:MAG TPA: hypothetical protein VFB62_28180 [Polyangiaceae bacterium]|nr:hypothetical protein [Polyangiaceae bacterium]
MRDVVLFESLRAGAPEPDELVRMLEELARLTLEERVPLFGVLPLGHHDARVRRAAMTALAGANGRLAMAAMLAALDDDDREVRLAAVEAWRSLRDQPMRWAHVVFHRDPDVRRAALDGPSSLLHFYLLADDICAPLSRAQLVREGKAALPQRAAPVLFDFHDGGRLSADEAVTLLLQLEPHAVIESVSAGPRRSKANREALLDGEAAPEDHDAFDRLWALCSAASSELRRKALVRMRRALLHSRAETRQRAVAAVLARGVSELDLASLVACAHPAALVFAPRDRDLKRAAALALLKPGGPVPTVTDDTLAILLRDLVPDAARVLDLRIAAALLTTAGEHPYERLLDVFDLEDVVAAFLRDPRHAAPLLALRDASKRGRDWFLAEVAGKQPAAHPLLLALLAWAVPSDGLEFVTELEPAHALALGSALVEIELEPGIELRENKVRNLSALIAERLMLMPTPEAALTGHVKALRDRAQRFLETFLALDRLEDRRFGLALVAALSRRLPTETFVRACARLASEPLERLLEILPYATGVTYGVEVAIAHALREHPVAAIAAWAKERLPEADLKWAAPVRREGVLTLSEGTQNAIVALSDANLDTWIHLLHGGIHFGLTAALARRPDPAAPSVEVCLALFGSDDDPQRIAEAFERWRPHDAGDLGALDARAVETWERYEALPLLGAAWLWRWERQAQRVATLLIEAGLGASLGRELASPTLRECVWRAAARALSIWVYRDRARVEALDDPALMDLLLEELDGDLGEPAAEIYLALYRVGVQTAVDALPRVGARVPDLPIEVRAVLRSLLSARGVMAARVRRKRGTVARELLEAIRASTDREQLERWCESNADAIVQEAALRLLELGETEVLAALIERCVEGWTTLVESLPLWPEGGGLDRARALLDVADAERRFRIALAFAERGERALAHAFRAACEPADDGWLSRRDRERLAALAGEREAAIELVRSPHPNAYVPSVDFFLTREDEAGEPSLVAFLEAGSDRSMDARVKAATWLHRRGNAVGFVVLLRHAIDPRGSYGRLFQGLDARYVDLAVEAGLYAGPAGCSETRLVLMLEPRHVDREARARGYERILLEATDARTTARVVQLMEEKPSRRHKLDNVAQVFAWGYRMGLAVTGRRHRVHMTRHGELGYTRLTSDRIFVSPFPMLRGERYGRQIVEGLVLHELGHHRWHRSDVWDKAHKQGMHGLLNLVADEHLERNLRALDSSWGDRLKRLAAYAFQHAARDLPVTFLLEVLGGRSFLVLSRLRLGLARFNHCVRVPSGTLLHEMEHAGLSFPRFARALRMGLGNRHDDPKVAEALALFDGRFRHTDMEGIFAIAKRLRDIFGWEASLAETCSPESLGTSAEEESIAGEGINDDEVQEEVERVLNPRKASGDGRCGKRLFINVSEEERFEEIHRIERLLPDRVRHAEVARDVMRPARRLRSYLERLGLAQVPTRFRLRGSRLDRARLTALVTRGEPRVLVQRQLMVMSDLFVGVLVDCSSSMDAGDNIGKARRFAVLVAEAAKGLQGVDVRTFGFTDSTIYDAGDAGGCAAASLETGGGNNDAAALFHAAGVARRSRRRAKLLVMVSDGLPTECSVNALRGLVRRLEQREGMCLAQVAVRPLEEICFPHHVLLEEADLETSVRRFGETVARLVRRAMA